MKLLGPFLLVSGVSIGAVTAVLDNTVLAGNDDGAKFTLVFLLLGGLLAGAGIRRTGWRGALAVGLWVPALHIGAKLLGLKDSVDPNTWGTHLILIPICVTTAGIGAAIGSTLRKAFSAPPAVDAG